MKKLTMNNEVTATIPQSNFTFSANYLRSCRLEFQNPETFEKTDIYLTRTDKERFRVKVFRGGVCKMAEYVKANSFEMLFKNLGTILKK